MNCSFFGYGGICILDSQEADRFQSLVTESSHFCMILVLLMVCDVGFALNQPLYKFYQTKNTIKDFGRVGKIARKRSPHEKKGRIASRASNLKVDDEPF